MHSTKTDVKQCRNKDVTLHHTIYCGGELPKDRKGLT
jgi:hypothetical protein